MNHTHTPHKLSIVICQLSISLAFASCQVKDPIFDAPTTGQVTLTTDWTNRTQGIDIPATYTAVVGGQAITLAQTTYVLSDVLAGTYSALIYNTPERITIDGTRATVQTTAGTVDPAPGWLFTYSGQVTFVAGEEHTATAIMVQQVRQLTIDLTMTEGNPDDLLAATASLAGIAGSMDYQENTYTGTALSVVPVLTKDHDRLTGTVRLLGLTAGEPQILTLQLTFADGKQQTIESDVSTQLAGFNTRKHEPMTLAANLAIATKAGLEATITGWEARTGSSGIAW